MEPGNRLCEVCGRERAEFFCSCTVPETMLCDSCLLKHTRKVSRKGHQSWPSSLLPTYKNTGFLERLEAFPRVSEEAIECIGQVERAIRELTAGVEAIQSALTAFCEEKVKELREMKESLARGIPAALEEVERTLMEDQPLLTTQYGPLFRKLTEKDTPLQLFTYIIETFDPLTLINVQYALTNPQELSPPSRLAGVFNDGVFLYEAATQEFTRCALAVNFGAGGSFVELDRNRLICLGAEPASTAVYLLDVPFFHISPLPFLSIPRCNAGVAKAKGQLYVFGGHNGLEVVRNCEKMNLFRKSWSEMKSMTYARSAFTPCYHHSLFYLASPAATSERKLETFDPETETYTVLPVALPSKLALGQNSVAFVYNEELCILTNAKQMARWKIDSESEFRVSNTGHIIWSNQQPVEMGSVMLIAHFGGVILFSLETFTEIKYVE
jgi:hypothetical protein